MSGAARARALVAVVLVLASVRGAAGQTPSSPLTLEQAVERFLARNLALEAARHRVDVARAERIAARVRPNPTLTLSAENLKVAGPTPAGELYEVGATYSQPLELGDKRRHRQEVAEAAVALAEAELAETLGQRLLEVKRAFYETLLAGQAVEEAVEQRQAIDELVAVVETRFREGAVAEADVLKTRLERARLDAEVAQAELARRQAGIKLLAHLGASEFSEAGAVADDTRRAPVVMPEVDVLRADALRQRAGVQAAARGLHLAERRLALERAQATVDVAPFVGLRRVGENSTVLLGVAIPLPLTDRNQGGIARAAAEERAARAELAHRRSQTLAEVEAAYHAWQSARARASALDGELLRQADESATIARRAYEEGAIDFSAYLEARRTLAAIRHQARRAHLETRLAVHVLEQAVGRELGR